MSTKRLKKIIKSLKIKHSQGYDEISVKILKLTAPFISTSLTDICNESFSSGIIPTILKFSILISI
jgi:hypothetical protein